MPKANLSYLTVSNKYFYNIFRKGKVKVLSILEEDLNDLTENIQNQIFNVITRNKHFQQVNILLTRMNNPIIRVLSLTHYPLSLYFSSTCAMVDVHPRII